MFELYLLWLNFFFFFIDKLYDIRLEVLILDNVVIINLLLILNCIVKVNLLVILYKIYYDSIFVFNIFSGVFNIIYVLVEYNGFYVCIFYNEFGEGERVILNLIFIGV